MKAALSILLALPFLVYSLLAPASTPAAASPAKPTIFVCGDSTAKYSASETSASDMQGWGTPIAKFFDPAKVTINNVGHAGTSSMSYCNGDWPRVSAQVKPGDFVLIVFGINDGTTLPGIGDETRVAPATQNATRTSPPAGTLLHTYGWYLSKMATDTHAAGATPIFLTVTTRNIWTNPNPNVHFDQNGGVVGALPTDYDPKLDRIERGTGNGRFTQWTKDVGRAIHVPVFDLTNCCADLYETMGRVEVTKFYQDHNHTHAAGAETVARCVTSGLKGLKNSPFVPLLSDAGKALPTADAKYVGDNLPGATSGPAN